VAALRRDGLVDELLAVASKTEDDRRIAGVTARERSPLRNFVHRRVPNEADAEGLLQDVFYETVEAYRLMEPV
jgi:DNA-directed RNA polymerase specialized sigma24 family protein